MNPDFAAFVIPTLIDFCASLGKERVSLGYTPNKVLRQYLRETTWFYPWARESGDDVLYADTNGSPRESQEVEKTRKRALAVRTGNTWMALLFGATFGPHAMSTQLYRDFYTSVLERSGVTVAGEGSNCSLGTQVENAITPWQQMVFFYLAGEGPKAIRTILKSLRVMLSQQTLLLLPLNMAAFVSRMQKTMSSEAIADQIRTVTLDANYPIVTDLVMTSLLPPTNDGSGTGQHGRPGPGILDRQRRMSLPDKTAGDVTYIGPYSSHDQQEQQEQQEQHRRQVIANQQQQQPRQPRGAASAANMPSSVRWTVVEEELFAIDETWSRFKQLACLSPEHPARATIRVYLASLPKPKVLIPHQKFVMDVLPYCDVSASVNLPEIVEFCRLFEDGWTWSPAKAVTRLIWTYDPYSTGAVDPKLAAYLRRYPKLTTETICGLLPLEFDK